MILRTRWLNQEFKASEHSDLFTHASMCRECDTCVKARANRKRHVKGALNLGVKPTQFGQQVTGDSLIDRHGINAEDPMFPGSTNALVMYDRATDWTECAPQGALNHEETLKAMRFFQGTSGRKVKSFYADNWPAITSAAAVMGWCNPHSTPGVPQSNGLAERMIRRVKEGGRSNLIQRVPALRVVAVGRDAPLCGAEYPECRWHFALQ